MSDGHQHTDRHGSSGGTELPDPDRAAPTDRQALWDERYAAHDHVWSATPNAEVERIVGDWPPGRALDLGAGEGRHAVWLASLGWRVTAVDFSSVGLAKGEQESVRRGLHVDWVVADARSWHPASGVLYDLVLVSYLHLPSNVVSRTRSWLAPGGALVVVGHGVRNLTDGVGGPSDPALLHSPEQLREAAGELAIERCEEYLRPTEHGDAIDVVLVARRPTG
ncbi:Methyltransferase domain-containing protein [Pedococcus dokdonensis]|uniref:Methyltransferase domain-containing protein n=1 Tax=Pedococcus dokdonensis TaxID=443156 RepID=A0A1H0MBY8_9MICO|nr:class I SAM-dependent methyltransferase [Pedococcus dokdonensis]SDO77845.1 Methyltransferase domain-containing protein [Pedococcus dokdonensis]